MRWLLWAALGALAEDWYIHHRDTFAAIQALPELKKLHGEHDQSTSALLSQIQQQNATVQALNIRLAENKDREIRTMSKEISEHNQLDKVRGELQTLQDQLEEAKEDAAAWKKKATKPTADPGSSLIQSDSPLTKKLKQALIQRTEAFEDLQDKANEYKANLAKMDDEMANWRRKTNEQADEINRMSEMNGNEKAASARLAAELSSAQAASEAAAANATAVSRELERARGQESSVGLAAKRALIQKTEAFEDLQDKANEYKANLAKAAEESANWRHKAHEELDEIDRMREESGNEKASSTQLTAELSSAQAAAAAAAAKAAAVQKELLGARSEMQAEKADVKKVLLQRTDSEESMEESLADYKAKLAASQNASIFANAKTASLALKLEHLSDLTSRETEVSKRLTGSLHHAEASAAAAEANASRVAKQRDVFVQQVQQLKTLLVQRTEQVEDAQDTSENAKRAASAEVKKLRAAADAARATATERAREVATAQRMAQDAGVRLSSALEEVASSKAAAALSAKREAAAQKAQAAWQAKAEQAKANLIAAMQAAETGQDRQAKLSDELRAAAAATANKTREVARVSAALRHAQAEAAAAEEATREATAALQAEKQHRAAAEKAQKASEEKAKHLQSDRDKMERSGRDLASQLQDAMDKQEETQSTIAAMRKNVSVQAAALVAEKAQVMQANAERQELQGRLSDEQVTLNAEKQQVAKALAESNLVRGLAANTRKEKQDALNRADALAAQVATLQSTVASAKANETKLLREEQEMQAEKKATLADSDQFFETAAKMQNSNDELKTELAGEKQTEATLRSKITELTQDMQTQSNSNKFQEQQLLDRLSANNDKLNKDEAILKRFRAQVQQMADAQRAQAHPKVVAKPKPSERFAAFAGKKTPAKVAVSAASKAAAKSATSKAAALAPSKQSAKSTRSIPSKPSTPSTQSKKASKPAANATKGLRGSK
jgi:chromosome segregation ATPase